MLCFLDLFWISYISAGNTVDLNCRTKWWWISSHKNETNIKNRRLEIFRNWMSDFEEILSIGTWAFQFFLVFFIHKKWKVPLNWGTACLFNHLLVHEFWMNWFIVLVQLIAAYWSKLTRSDFSFQDSIQLFYLKFITN